MSEVLITILAVVFVLGVAINIHEFGHFIVAKLLGMRIEAYSFFGLGPRIWGFKRGHTDYRISAIPLGAYVKLYGDEATASLEGGESDGEVVPDDELYELRPRWQKFLVLIGGPFMNVVLSLAIPLGMALYMGVPPVPEPVVGFLGQESAAAKAGLQVGDRIVAVDGIQNPTWEQVNDHGSISANRDLPVEVVRNGQTLPITIRPETVNIAGNELGVLGIAPDIGEEPVVVNSVVKDSAAEAAGIKAQDKIVSLNGEPVRNSQVLSLKIQESKETPVKIGLEREGQALDLEMTPRATGDGLYMIGVGFEPVLKFVPTDLSGAASYALASNWRILRMTGTVLGQLFTGKRAVKEAGLSGPVGIVRTIANASSGDQALLKLTFLLMAISLSLGVFNLLPIPLLDGGQIMVLGIEKVLSWFGQTLSMAIREKIQIAGLGIILLLMAFTFFLDISKFF